MTVRPGTRLGPYEVVELLGAGGMGEVYRARDPRLSRDVAVKVLPAEVAGDAQRLGFFEREARAVAALNHPNILTVHDVGTHEGVPYVVMELLEGENLRELDSRRSPTVKQILGYSLQAARGLEAAHAKGIVHRDLKPENLFLTTDGRVKVLDFGLAKLVRREKAATDTPTASGLSGPGQVLGTVAYMSPEQARGYPVDARSDVFSFGVVLYELLARKHPFRRDTAASTLTAIVEETPAGLESLSRGIPPAVGGVVRRCLEKAREDRYASGHEVAVALEAVLAAPTAAAALLEVEERSPYPGLSSFTEKDAGVFFGREEEVEALWGRLKERKLLAVIGPSGAGKTSFVRAGLLPAKPAGWAAVVSTPDSAPARSLAQALAPELAGDPEAVVQLLHFDEADVAVDAVSRWRQGHGEALLVVDQLEELFTLNPPDVRGRFATLLGRLANEADVHVLLSLRDDFLICCCEHAELAPVLHELTALLPLEREDLRRALVEPAKKRGYRFEDAALVKEMVEAVEGARAALPLLAFAMSRLWEKRDRERKLLTREAYESIGGVAGALAQHAEETLARIGVECQGIVREVFRNLVTSQGTRAVAERDELLSVFPERPVAGKVLGELIESRLLTSYEIGDTENGDQAEGAEGRGRHRIEIVHESLLSAWPRLVRWRAQDEEGALLRDQLKQAAQTWQEHGRSEDLLWTGTAFREFRLWRERYAGGLSQLEEAFARAMAELAGRRRRRRRLAVTAVILIFGVGLGAMTALRRQSEQARQRAVAEARRAEAAKLLALSRLELDGNPSAAVAYALASLELGDTPEARRLALEALQRGPTATRLPMAQWPWVTEFSPDGRWLAVGDAEGNVNLFSREGGRPSVLRGHEGVVDWLQFGPRSDVLASWANDWTIRLWSVPGGEEIRTLEGFPMPIGIRGERLFTWVARGEQTRFIQSWPLEGGEATRVGRWQPPPDAPSKNYAGFQLDPGGQRLAWPRGQGLYLGTLPGSEPTPPQLVGRHEHEIEEWRFDPRGERIASVDRSGQIRIWSLAARSAIPLRVLQGQGDVIFLEFDRSGSRFVACSSDGTAWLWDLAGPPDAEPLEFGLGGQMLYTAFDPGSRWLATSNDSGAAIWPLGHVYPHVFRGHTKEVIRVAFAPDGSWVASVSRDGTLRVWPLAADGKRGGVLFESRAPPPLRKDLYSLAVDPEGRRLLTAGTGGTVWVVPLEGGPTRELSGFRGYIWTVAFGPRGRLAAAGAALWNEGDEVIRIWSLESGDVRVLDAGDAALYADLQFTPDGRLLSAGSNGLRIWNPADGQHELLRKVDRDTIGDVDSSRDGRRVLSVDVASVGTGRISELMLHDLEDGSAQTLTSLGSRVCSVALDPTGTIAVTGDADGVVRVGRVTGEEPHLLFGHQGGVLSVAVSPDGRWIAATGGTELRLWPMPQGRPFHTLPYAELLGKLRALTNFRAVEDDESATGYRIEAGPFPGWKDVPTW